MLMMPSHVGRDQLLSDLMDLRAKIDGKWTKDWGACLIASMEMITNHTIGVARVPGENPTTQDLRLGRMILAVYVAVYGENAPTNITLSQAQHKIISFNDSGRVNKEVVLLAIDRAIQAIFEPVMAAAEPSGI